MLDSSIVLAHKTKQIKKHVPGGRITVKNYINFLEISFYNGTVVIILEMVPFL